jgi:hypothetical protein
LREPTRSLWSDGSYHRSLEIHLLRFFCKLGAELQPGMFCTRGLRCWPARRERWRPARTPRASRNVRVISAPRTRHASLLWVLDLGTRLLTNLTNRPIEVLLVAAGDHNPRAFAGELRRDGPAEAFARRRHQCHLAFETEIQNSLLTPGRLNYAEASSWPSRQPILRERDTSGDCDAPFAVPESVFWGL